MNRKKIITRFAPSPTGELHIGGARAALFEFLAAKSTDGKFLLRIEDTDRERFVEGATERIIDALKWLNIIPENLDNVVVQSERLHKYHDYALRLVEEGKAYICTCSKEKLGEDRKKQEAGKLSTGYVGHCRESGIRIEDVRQGEYVIRMKVPKSGKLIVDDLIRGEVEFDLSLIDDQIILKSDGYPTYYLAAAVDDEEMDISHVIRGEEWLSSTPKSIILNEMLGFRTLKYAHMPMVLAPDRSKLSKRHGATSVVDYKNLGYLPEAVVNFLVLQGWSPKDNREFFSLDELVREFDLGNVNKAPAVFNIEKLNSINQHYIQEQLMNQKSKIKTAIQNYLADISDEELELVGRGGFNTLKEMADYIMKLRKEPEYPAEILVFKKSDRNTTLKALQNSKFKIQNSEDWSAEYLQELLKNVVCENNMTNGDVFWPVRVALSGAEKSPSPVELMMALGKEKSLERIQNAIDKLSSL